MNSWTIELDNSGITENLKNVPHVREEKAQFCLKTDFLSFYKIILSKGRTIVFYRGGGGGGRGGHHS